MDDSNGDDRGDATRANLTATHRDRTANDRDERAEAHDRESEARDDRAEARDQRAEARELAAHGRDSGAASDRAGARRDRRGGASDRTQASDDREAASADRLSSAEERETFSIDQLTGAYRREVGLLALERELVRAKRTNHAFTLAFVDVDGLKATNDSLGHAAGDQLLQQIAGSIKNHLRDYDVVVRVGGDEFVCGLPEMTAAEAAERFARVDDDLAVSQASITVGFSELGPGDGLDELIAQADADLYRIRRERRPAGA